MNKQLEEQVKQEAERIIELFTTIKTCVKNETIIRIGNKYEFKHNSILLINEIIKEYELMAPSYKRKKYWQEVKNYIETNY